MQTGESCKKIPYLMQGSVEDGVLLKVVKYFEALLK